MGEKQAPRKVASLRPKVDKEGMNGTVGGGTRIHVR